MRVRLCAGIVPGAVSDVHGQFNPGVSRTTLVMVNPGHHPALVALQRVTRAAYRRPKITLQHVYTHQPQ